MNARGMDYVDQQNGRHHYGNPYMRIINVKTAKALTGAVDGVYVQVLEIPEGQGFIAGRCSEGADGAYGLITKADNDALRTWGDLSLCFRFLGQALGDCLAGFSVIRVGSSRQAAQVKFFMENYGLKVPIAGASPNSTLELSRLAVLKQIEGVYGQHQDSRNS